MSHFRFTNLKVSGVWGGKDESSVDVNMWGRLEWVCCELPWVPLLHLFLLGIKTKALYIVFVYIYIYMCVVYLYKSYVYMCTVIV